MSNIKLISDATTTKSGIVCSHGFQHYSDSEREALMKMPLERMAMILRDYAHDELTKEEALYAARVYIAHNIDMFLLVLKMYNLEYLRTMGMFGQ